MNSNPVQPEASVREVVSVEWVANQLEISRHSVLRLLSLGKIKGYRITGSGWWRIYRDSVSQYEDDIRRN